MFKMQLIILCGAVLTFTINVTLGARILGIIPTPSYSHQIVFRPIWKELSLRGHQVTVITTDPINNSSLTNLTEIDLHSAYKVWQEIDMFGTFEKPIWRMFFGLRDISYKLMDTELSHPEVEKLIQDKSVNFDLLMVEAFHTPFVAFAERFKCPSIAMSSLDATAFVYHEIGNPAHPVLHPDFMLPFAGKLTFTERLSSTFNLLFLRWLQRLMFLPDQQLLIKKHFGENYPLASDIFKNVSLLFINTNSFVHPIRPLLPNVIQIGGGTHLTSENLLPKDLQVVLDNATGGFIYFSLGSNVKSKDLPNEIRENILEAFKEIPYTVLWKFENDKLPNKPENVIVSKWFPQQDIFRHPNIKLFITQGGLQSMEEALYNYIPLIGIPVIGDQKANVNKMVSQGLGLYLDYKTITKEIFKSAMLEVINNRKYRERVIEIAESAKDQPESGLERAIWWTEYVIRHKGVPHLRNPGIDLPWYQYFLLDVIGFCLFVILVALYLLYRISKLLLKICRYFKSSPKLKEM